MSDTKPNLLTIYLQLMKLRVVILLQITAICAIMAHDLMTRSGAIPGDRTWYDTAMACVVTILGGPWRQEVQMQSIWFTIVTSIQPCLELELGQSQMVGSHRVMR